MKKRVLSLILTLCFGLSVPALAADMGEWAVIVPGGPATTAAIDREGVLWMWGDNHCGQMGDGSGLNSVIPVKIMENVAAVTSRSQSSVTAAIQTDGTLWMWGYNANGQLGNGQTGVQSMELSPVKVMDNVASVSVGGSCTAAVRTDGSLWMWGGNRSGQLGQEDLRDFPTPVKVMDDVAAVSCGGSYTAAIRGDGSLWMWGDNTVGQLGIDTAQNPSLPVKVMEDVTAVSCGTGHTAAIKSDGSLWVWGNNWRGQVGDGTQRESSPPAKILDNVTSVSCGSFHTAAVQAGGVLSLWGMNDFGQVGNGTQTDAPSPVVILDSVDTVYCGASHTAAWKTDGTLWAWGEDFQVMPNFSGGGMHKYASLSTTYHIQPQQIPLGNEAMPIRVRLRLNGGTGANELWSKWGGVIAPPTNPTKEGCTFAGWYTDEALSQPWNFNSLVIPGLTLYAKWVPVSSQALTVTRSVHTVTLNGWPVGLNAYVLKADNGGDVNYVRLRDVAQLLADTQGEFQVDWRDGAIHVTTRSPYTASDGDETVSGMDGSYRWNTAPVLFDGVAKPLEGIVLTDAQGGGHTFFKLRDLGAAIGFHVDWTPEQGILLDTDRGQSGGTI